MLKEVKKSLCSLGLATSLLVSTTGCGSDYSNTELHSENQDIYRTCDYFLFI